MSIFEAGMMICFGASWPIAVYKTYKAKRNIKKTANNQITLPPGRHNVVVTKEGVEVYNQEIFVSATDIKVIEL